MASFQPRNGRWRALIRRAGRKPISNTFPTKAAAQAWARKVESDLDHGKSVAAITRVTIGELLQAYRKLRAKARPIKDTSNEHYMLKNLDKGLGTIVADALTVEDLVGWCGRRRDEDGAGSYTLNMEISKLSTALRYACAVKKLVLPDVVGQARPVLTHLGLIGGGGKRERRPTDDELQRLLTRIAEHRGLVYAEAVAFSAVSAMRRGEVCSFGFEEIDSVNRVVPVWRKHPRKGKVLERVPLLGEAWEIIQRRPRGEPEDVLTTTTDKGEVLVRKTRVFPITPGTLSTYFTEACRHLDIPDLHLHDMRHEGTSRLFEQGLDIPEVALVTGHKDWKHLKRYTNLRPEDLTKKR